MVRPKKYGCIVNAHCDCVYRTDLAWSNQCQGRIPQEPDSFISQAFNGATPEPSRVLLKGDVKKQIKETFLVIVINPFVSLIGAKAIKTVWILERIGKELPITAGFVIADDKIENFRVLVFRESRGWEIRNDFLPASSTGATW